MRVYEKITTPSLKQVKVFNLLVYKKEIDGMNSEKSIFAGVYKSKKSLTCKRRFFMGIRIYKKKYSFAHNPQPSKTIVAPPKPALPEYNYTNAFIMEYFCERQQQKYIKSPINIKMILETSKSAIISCTQNYLNKSHGWMKYIFGGQLWPIDSLPYDNKGADVFVLLGGVGQTPAQINTLVEAMQVDKPVLILEAAFLRSINTFCEEKHPPKFRYDVGFVLDYLTAYYDATRPSYLELLLNDFRLVLSKEQITRARNCINKIVFNHLSKYNCQPIFTPSIGRNGVKKILVIDQSFGDNSIKKGFASINTFNEMLNAAIKENPGADIIVKTHPDTKTGAKLGYYSKIKTNDNIYLYTEPINPISLIQYVDKVYVCTSQFGFEAAMCGKEVHVFGMPFYAGWGITNDRQKCERRTNKRTLEEVFYITYIMYSIYVNPEKECICEIEEAIDFLLNLRKEYFASYGISNKISHI